jgi:hypothetical protein
MKQADRDEVGHVGAAVLGAPWLRERAQPSSQLGLARRTRTIAAVRRSVALAAHVAVARSSAAAAPLRRVERAADKSQLPNVSSHVRRGMLAISTQGAGVGSSGPLEQRLLAGATRSNRRAELAGKHPLV